jgi:hypothetical protein
MIKHLENKTGYIRKRFKQKQNKHRYSLFNILSTATAPPSDHKINNPTAISPQNMNNYPIFFPLTAQLPKD